MLHSPLDQSLNAHAGLALGEAVSAGEQGILGDAANMAARLAALAADREILIDPALYVELEDVVETHDLGKRALKGIAPPVNVRRLKGIDNRANAASVWPRIGKTAELSQILAAADAASDERAGSVFVLRGEPGIGKTRLIEKVEQRLGEEGFTAHRGVFMNFGAESSRDAAAFALKEARGPRFHIAVGDLIDAPTVPELKSVEAAPSSPRRRT